MKRLNISISAGIAFVTLCALRPTLAQGPLTPPGTPAPTMKTLDQIEPRRPVNAVNTPGDTDSIFRITQPGSYYLTTNVSGPTGRSAIEIAANNVSLDLMGFELAGVSGSLAGIHVDGERTNLFIGNGTVRAWDVVGVEAGAGRNVVVQNLRVSANAGIGLRVGNGSIVNGCAAWDNLSAGIYGFFDATIVNCVASRNGAGIFCTANSTVTGCTASENSGPGIQAGGSATVTDCTASNNGAEGILAANGSTLRSCTARGNQGDGFAVQPFVSSGRGTIIDCTAESNGGAGVSALFAVLAERVSSSLNSNGIAVGPGSQVQGCLVFSNQFHGILVGIGSTVKGSTVRQNGGDGIRVPNDCVVAENHCTGNTGAGIRATIAGNRLEGNNTILNGQGVLVDGGANLILRNSARFNPGSGSIGSSNFVVAAGNTIGPIQTGSGVATNHAWANFSY